MDAYQQRLDDQIDQYKDMEDLQALPGIFSYWANKYLVPPLVAVTGTHNPVEFYARYLLSRARPGETAHYLSIGCGDCQTEVPIAQQLVQAGLTDFTFEC